MSFQDNNKDMNLYVESGSHVLIDQVISTGCKTDSITYREYSSNISDIKQFVENKTTDFSPEEIDRIKKLLDEMENVKESPTKIQKLLKEISKIGTSMAPNLLLTYIKMKFGW